MNTDGRSTVQLIDPNEIDRNPENPRLIFREDELLALQDSIATQGILVPLTVYSSDEGYVILDGERRWRCALKLGLTVVPAIIQPEPDPVTNIMMMFAIHKTRNDWDPLPTAIKLNDLRKALGRRLGREPKEGELAAAASLQRGEVRRYRNIMGLPEKYKVRLLAELEKPRPDQKLTVDHVLESVRGARALLKQEVLNAEEAAQLVDVIVDKFVGEILTSTVEPRLLTRIARAVGRQEVPVAAARRVALKIINNSKYTIFDAFNDSVERIDFAHGTEQLATRVIGRLQDHLRRSYELGETLEASLKELQLVIRRLLKNAGS
jgi:ParB family transcriptional regulator, chromosome partitioning protein